MFSNSIFRSLTVLVATLVTIAVNSLANILPINGQGTGEISDRFDILFVPAGYVFSIWGLIYLGLLAFAVYQLSPANREKSFIRAISPAYILASLANSAWIFFWHYERFPLTVLTMLVLLASLIMIYRRLANQRSDMGRPEQLFVMAPFSIYLGWISVATIANISQLLDYLSWSAWGIPEIVWAAALLLIATGLGLAFVLKENDWLSPLVLVWAFVGIAIKQADAGWLPTLAYGLAALLFVFSVLRLAHSRQITLST